MSPRLICIVIACAAAAPLPAFAQSGVAAANRADARCAIALQGASEQVTGDSKSAMQTLMVYFVGKIVGRSGQTAARDAIAAADKEVQPGEFATIVKGCADEATQLGAVLGA